MAERKQPTPPPTDQVKPPPPPAPPESKFVWDGLGDLVKPKKSKAAPVKVTTTLTARLRQALALHSDPSRPDYDEKHPNSEAAAGGEGKEAKKSRSLEQREQDMRADAVVVERAERIAKEPAASAYERENALWIADAEIAMERALANSDTATRYMQADGTYTPERRELHREILAEFAQVNASKPSGLERPVIVFMGGLPASGKSTGAADLDLKNMVAINADAFKTGSDELTKATWKRLPEYTGAASAAAVHEESSYLAEKALAMARQQRQNIVFDATMGSYGAPDDGGVAGKVAKFKAAGYRVEARFMDVSPDIAVERALKRYVEKAKANDPEARYVPSGYVRSLKAPQFGSKNRATFERIKDALDAWRVFDSNGSKPMLVAEKRGGA